MSARRFAPRPALAAALVLAAAALFSQRDLLTGASTPAYRDLATTQRPSRALAPVLGGAKLNPAASFGQAFRGNPNLVLAYPFPVAPRWMGVQLLLHLALGLLGMFLFLRTEIRSEEAALLGALAWGFSGFAVSSAAFLNAATTLAWAPWLLFAVARARAADGVKGAARAGLVAVFATYLLVLGGEPALAALALLLAFAWSLRGPSPERLRGAGALLGGGLVAAVLASPWLVEVWKASLFASRRVHGFTWSEFSAVGFHPLRLLETPFPQIFGDPSRVVSGAFWGFAATQGNPPYHASLGFGVVPFALALVFVLSARRGEARFWVATAGVALAASFTPWLPGARSVYEALPFLHVLRYPVKALLPFTMSVAVLAAYGADRLLVQGAVPRFRRRASQALLALAVLFAMAAIAARLSPRTVFSILLTLWDPAWASPPDVVLAPVLARLPAEAALTGAGLAVLGLLVARGAEDARGGALLLTSAAVSLLAYTPAAIPRVPASVYSEPSPLVARAAALGGRVFERAGKDFDAVRRGAQGRVETGGILDFALAQARQGWALSGAPHGLKYAWDPDPDGSYTILNRYAADVLRQRPWAKRLKWLRAAGVTAVIAGDVPPETPGLSPVFIEASAGVPVTLWRLENALPGVRRAGRVVVADTVNATVDAFEDAGFDPATDVVVHAKDPSLASKERDPSGAARVTEDGADRLVVETSGERPGILRVDRSFTPRATAAVDGRPATVYAADLNLIGIPVPAGASRVVVDLAP
ncbi:MAG TPA: hypothetical protein VMV60_14460 [Thermoanaerobaculia bacterium]|nr:hypothetical protein [Thermoanaerobaculia bacterium]